MDLVAFSMLVANCWDSLSFSCTFLTPPQKSLETEFWESKEALEGQLSARQLLFGLLKNALWQRALQQHCRWKQVRNLRKSEARGELSKLVIG